MCVRVVLRVNHMYQNSIENFWFHDGFGKISDEKGSVIKKL